MRTQTKKSLESFFRNIAKHPFLTTAGFCLLLFLFGFCDRSHLTPGSYYYAGGLLIAAVLLLVLFGRIGASLQESVIVFLTAAVFIAGGLMLIYKYDGSPVLLLWMALFVIAVLVALMRLTDMLTVRNFIILMIAAGIILRYVYCLYTTSGDRQHDVGFFNFTWGHANYIEHWYKNGLKLPDKDEIYIWQYYHPPLHHWLMALMLRLLTDLGMKYTIACQALQFLPFLYSSLLIIVCYRVFRWVKLKGLGLLIAMAIMCFHPVFVLMGGFFNNDMLTVLLMMSAVMFALKWYRKQTLLNIIPIALCVGLGMMTKLSAWMAAPPIAVLFLFAFFKDLKSWVKKLVQFVVFGVICAPLGLWWPIRNLTEFEMPMNYVPYLSEADPIYSGDMEWTKRIFDFGNGQTSFVYDAYTAYGAPYNEYNPTLGLVKTSLYGEGTNGISDVNFPQISVWGPILFWIGTILALLCVVGFVVSMISKKSGLDVISRIFFPVFAVTMLASYYYFCFKFPFTCTMNIRYCVPLIPLFAMGLGLWLQKNSGDTRPQKVFRYTVCVLTAAFAVATAVVYSLVALPVPAIPVA